MTFFETPEGQDFYKLFNKMASIDATHNLYMMEIFEFMNMAKIYDEYMKKAQKDVPESTKNIIRRVATSIKNRKEFETFTKYATDYDYEFLPVLINAWANEENK